MRMRVPCAWRSSVASRLFSVAALGAALVLPTAPTIAAADEAGDPPMVIEIHDDAGQVQIIGGDDNMVRVVRPGEADEPLDADNELRAAMYAAAGAWKAGPDASVGAPGQQQAAATAIPNVLELVGQTVESWRTNYTDAVAANEFPGPNGYPPNFAVYDLTEVDEKTREAIDKLNAENEAKNRDLVVEYAAKVDKLYRNRLAAARDLLNPEDQKLFDAALSLWAGYDVAEAAVKEEDPAKRRTALNAARVAYFNRAITALEPGLANRLLTVCATHRPAVTPIMDADFDLCMYLGQTRLTWNELFGDAGEDLAAKLEKLTNDYWTEREAAHAAFRGQRSKATAEKRKAVIELLPAGEDRDTLAKLNEWQIANAENLLALSQALSVANRRLTIEFNTPVNMQQERWKEFNTKYNETSTQLAQLNRQYTALWPKAFMGRAWGKRAGVQGKRAKLLAPPPKPAPVEEEF